MFFSACSWPILIFYLFCSILGLWFPIWKSLLQSREIFTHNFFFFSYLYIYIYLTLKFCNICSTVIFSFNFLQRCNYFLLFLDWSIFSLLSRNCVSIPNTYKYTLTYTHTFNEFSNCSQRSVFLLWDYFVIVSFSLLRLYNLFVNTVVMKAVFSFELLSCLII